MSDIECFHCDGTGEEEFYEDHHPNCDGGQCEQYDCPFVYSEDCTECEGSGYIHSDDPEWWLNEPPTE